MPGIAGIVTADGHARLNDDLSRMASALRRDGQHSALWLDAPNLPQAALAWIGHPWHVPAHHVATIDGSTIVVDGELYHSRSDHRAPQAKDSADGAATRLLRGYLREGASFLAGLEGRFTGAIWNGPQRRLALFNDKFGTKPLYVHRAGGALTFAAEIKALLALPQTPRRLNRTGLAQFFTFGHLWNRDTLLESIGSLDAATLIEWEPSSDYFLQTRYWRPQPAGRLSSAASLEAIDSAFKAAVDDQTLHTAGLGISLSGGLDARTILAGMDHPHTPAVCVSMGMEGSLDRESARQLAQLVECDFRPFVLDQRFLSQFDRHLADMVALTDGHYLSQCIVMPTLPLYRELGVRVLLRGHAGELLHMHKAYNFSIDSEAANARDEPALKSWLAARLQSHLLDGVPEPLMCGVDQGDFDAMARHSLEASLADTAQWDHPVDRISQLFLDQRTRRETAMSLVKFDSEVDVRLPYLDSRLVEEIFRAPPALRLGDELQTHILRRRRPEFLRPPNSNTGAPVGANALSRTWRYYRMKVLAKLGVQGYQPYERLGLWLRRELRPTVESLLMDSACLDRGLLEPDAVRNVVRRHLSGERNHTFLLMAMMILERGVGRALERPGVEPEGAQALKSESRLASPRKRRLPR